MATKTRTSREELWDALSDILEETGTQIPAPLRQEAIVAIERCQREDHAPTKRPTKRPPYSEAQLRRDVRDLVAYNWADEEEDFKQSTEAERKLRNVLKVWKDYQPPKEEEDAV